MTSENVFSSYGGFVYNLAYHCTSILIQLSAHPEWQDRIRRELVGKPIETFADDQSCVPQTIAFMLECMRLKLDVPTLLMTNHEDYTDIHGNQWEKGTTFVLNIGKCLQDDDMGDSSASCNVFDPTRFIQSGDVARDRMNLAFGGGCRICPGRHMGMSSMVLLLQSIFQQWNQISLIHPPIKDDFSTVEFELQNTK